MYLSHKQVFKFVKKSAKQKKFANGDNLDRLTKQAPKESNQIPVHNFVPILITVRDRYNVNQTELARSLIVITSTKLKEKTFGMFRSIGACLPLKSSTTSSSETISLQLSTNRSLLFTEI